MSYKNVPSLMGAILCRVSTAQQSNLRQVEHLLEYAQRKGYTVYPDHVYEDKVSGFSSEESRPELNRFYKDAESGVHFDAVFVSEASRIARKPIEGYTILHRITEKLKIPIYVQDKDMCSMVDGKSSYVFDIMMSVLFQVGKLEADGMKIRSIEGKVTKAKMGGYVGGPPAYGYRVENDRLVIDNEEAEVVRRIFNYAFQGLGATRIRNILNDEKIKTRHQKNSPNKVMKFKGGQSPVSTNDLVWSDKTIQDMLKNPRYKGEAKYKGLVLPSPVIVEPKLWKDVQNIVKERFKSKMKETKYHFILQPENRKLVRCGRCGRNYVGRFNESSSEENYQCSSTRKKGGSCGNRALSISRLDGAVWAMVAKSGWVHDFMASNGINQDRLRAQIETLEKEIQVYGKKMSNTINALKRLLDLYLDPSDKGTQGITKEQYQAKKNELEAIFRNAEIQTDRLTREKQGVEKTLESLLSIDNIEGMIEEVKSDSFQMSKILGHIIERIIITSETTVTNNNKYLLSMFVKGFEMPYSYVFIKKKGQLLSQPVYDNFHRLSPEEQAIMAKRVGWPPVYNERGILQGDVREIIANIERTVNQPITGTFVVDPDPIPFQHLNIKNLNIETNKSD
jgi:DNA invertase Pin-like site-specific DNA recombinase